jgi:hypothetical protein
MVRHSLPAVRRLLCSGLLVALAIAPGCGKGERLVPVHGKVTVNGKPLSDGVVIFEPDVQKGNHTTEEPRGMIADSHDGSFELSCRGGKGAPLGHYRVVIWPMKQPTPETGMRTPEWLANARYTDSKTSGLTAEVVDPPPAGGYNFDLSR